MQLEGDGMLAVDKGGVEAFEGYSVVRDV